RPPSPHSTVCQHRGPGGRVMSRHPRRSHPVRHATTTTATPRVFTPRPIIGRVVGRPGRTPIIGSAALPHHWGRVTGRQRAGKGTVNEWSTNGKGKDFTKSLPLRSLELYRPIT